MAGWIRVERRLFKGDIGTDPHLLLVWIHLLAMAEWRDKKVKHGKEQVRLERGQAVLSVRLLAAGTRLSKSTVGRCLDYLKKTERIRTQSGTQGTIVTILKYKDYQSNEESSGTHPGTEPGTRQGHARDTTGTRPGHSTEENPIPTKGLAPPNKGTREQVLTTEQLSNGVNLKINSCPAPRAKRVRVAKVIKYDEADKTLAIEWARLAVTIAPTSNPNVEKFAGSINQAKRITGLTDPQMRQLFDFIEADDFWKFNAYSPGGLLKKSESNGNRKIDNIISRMLSRTKLSEEQALFKWARDEQQRERNL